MALKNSWVDKIDGESDILAQDINQIAHSVIELEEDAEKLQPRIDELSEAIDEQKTAFDNKIDSITEVVATEPDTTNLWTLGDVEVERYKKYALALPAGTYTISLLCTSTDTDSDKCLMRFYADDLSLKSLGYTRNETISRTVTFAEDVTHVYLYASSNAINSEGDTAHFTNVIVVDNNAVIEMFSAVDNKAREEIALTNSDVEYIQNPNLYDGEWTVGRYIYDTGAVYKGTSTHCRNVYPVPLDQNKEYNVAVKAEFANKTMSVYIYDSNKVFIERVTTRDIVHISGASFINFAIERYSTDFPGEPLHVMVWESDSTVSYTEWLEYGEKGSYIRSKQIIPDTAIEKAMLSRDKARFDDSFNYVAYSRVNGSDGAINTAEHFKWACKQGFTGIKGDVRPTSDGVLIMCHDAGFTLTDSGTITTYNADTATPIHDMTAEQCLALQHGNGNYVCSFDEYIKICKKYGKIAYITIRDEYIDEVVAAMFPILDKYNMRTRCIVNSFTLASLQAVRAEDNAIMLSQVLGSGSTITEAAINRAISLGNCMICGFDFPNFGEFDDITDSVVAYARENDIRLYEAQINSMEKVEQLMEYGISGAQMTVVPVFD